MPEWVTQRVQSLLPYIEVLSIRFLSEMLHDPLVNINENYSTMGERFYSVVVTEIN